jgi:hypothetical protein
LCRTLSEILSLVSREVAEAMLLNQLITLRRFEVRLHHFAH